LDFRHQLYCETSYTTRTWNGHKEAATMTSEALCNSEPPNVLFIYNEDTKNAVPTNMTHVRIDPSVKEIHDRFFANNDSLVEVEFSEGLERIGRGVFCNCKHLKHINKLPSTLKKIGDYAFFLCRSLDSIEFPEGLQVIGEYAFYHCSRLTRIKIPSAPVVIRWSAFSTCSRVIFVELPEGLQVIGKSWFRDCKSLTTVNIPSSVKEIQDSAFDCCVSLASLDLPAGLEAIGDGSFSQCKSLASLRIPSTVCKIGSFAFSSCEGLRSITLPETLETIECDMFSRCTSLTHIEIPPTVTRIRSQAFQGCKCLKHLRIPSSVLEIEYCAFEDCKQLMSVHLLGKLHKIHARTFFACSSLTHVRIPPSVTRIERGAFMNCIGLISLELPEGLETIDLDDQDEDPYFSSDSENSDGQKNSNIYGCQSLVNFVIPAEQRFAPLEFDEEFMEQLKLRHVASGFGRLFSAAQHRFDDLPVHRLCYYQSYHPLTEAMDNLRQVVGADPSAGAKVDAFGMTPFHILALAQTPNFSLFQELLKLLYNVDVIRTRDKFGSTPIDYLCLNHIPEATTVAQSLLQTIFTQCFRRLGLDRWKSELWNTMDEALTVELSSRRKEIGMLCFKLATYERLESISLLELALWKGKIDGWKAADDTDHHHDEQSSPKRPRLDKSNSDSVDRESCRINSGADVVISNVLSFLDKVCRADY
jgi:hypothetical protein